MDDSLDITASSALCAMLAIALGGHAVASAHAGRALSAGRVDREQGLPFIGRAPMHAVYRALVPVGRLLASAGVHANSVTLFSVVAAFTAASAFAFGHFGVGAALGCIAALADAVDGIVAREGGTSSRLGQVLDTTVDRYVDALLLGGIAVYLHQNVALLVLVLAAIVGGFMVSYASSVERELGSKDPGSTVPMRRPHRLAYLLTGAALGPLVGRLAGADHQDPVAGLVPVLLAVGAIAVVGNFSAVRRLVIAGSRFPTSASASASATATAGARVPPDSTPDAAAPSEPRAIGAVPEAARR